MDSDSWISRLAAAKRHQISQLDRLGMVDFEVVGETRLDFACPYCYEDHDVASLCNHLEDEHSLEPKITRRRRLRRVAMPNSQALSLLGRDLREAHLQMLLGGGGYRPSNTTTPTVVTDSLLSSLCLNFPSSEVEDPPKSTISTAESSFVKKTSPLQTWKSSIELSLSHEERERRRKQATVRAKFMQDMLLSTLIGE